MDGNPYASFDAIALLCKTQRQLQNASETELQLLSYLACLLSLYQNHPVSAWGYEFYCTNYGIPFSRELSESLNFLSSIGVIKNKEGFYYTTEATESILNDLESLNENKVREPFLEAAGNAIISLPIGNIRDALINEPSFYDKSNSGGTRPLFDNPGLDILYEQFSALSEAVGVHVSNLLVPAVVWISYLTKIQNEEVLLNEN